MGYEAEDEYRPLFRKRYMLFFLVEEVLTSVQVYSVSTRYIDDILFPQGVLIAGMQKGKMKKVSWIGIYEIHMARWYG